MAAILNDGYVGPVAPPADYGPLDPAIAAAMQHPQFLNSLRVALGQHLAQYAPHLLDGAVAAGHAFHPGVPVPPVGGGAFTPPGQQAPGLVPRPVGPAVHVPPQNFVPRPVGPAVQPTALAPHALPGITGLR